MEYKDAPIFRPINWILIIVLAAILILVNSCSYRMQLYDVGLLVPETIEIEFKTEREATRVQKRITKHCSKPDRKHKTLYLNKEHIQCNRKILKRNYGFIREKYRGQINKQME